MNWLSKLVESVPDDPFYGPRKPLWLPPEMSVPPTLPAPLPLRNPRPRTALLLNPFYAKSPHGSFGKHVLTPTLALTSLGGATPENWAVRYWDENLLQGPPPCEPLPQAVGITVHLTFAKRAYELARWFRAQGSTVILGGLHIQSCPDEVAPHADAIVIGDGVQVWPQILRDVETGKLKQRYEATYDRPFALDPPPRRELLPRGSFLTTTSLIATRGCHNRCGFCYLATDGLRMPYRVRETGDIRRQFESDKQPYAVFIDNNLGSRRDYLRDLCRALRPARKIWSAAVTLDVTDEPSLVRKMALAGCTGVFIGFESLTDQNLADARKRTPRADDYARRVRMFHENGIQVNGSFVVGFDGDRRDTFTTLVQWIEGVRMECATFHILTPYPGTPLFRQMESEGRLLHRDWEKYDTAHVVFRPKQMTPEELLLGYDWLYRRLFSHASIWRRRPPQLSALPTYLAGCYLYKRSNRLWRWLIKHRLVHLAWSPLVEASRLRHLAFRRRLAMRVEPAPIVTGCATPFPASV
ncbi:MAG TPA: radical SAM protein [Verrucomicrobiae bacterium]|nr:radical SAM protein [Verrucomicrobiae bacterium]